MFSDQTSLMDTLSCQRQQTRDSKHSSVPTEKSTAPPGSTNGKSSYSTSSPTTQYQSSHDSSSARLLQSWQDLQEQALFNSEPIATRLLVHQLLSALQNGSGVATVTIKPEYTHLLTDCISHSMLSFDPDPDSAVGWEIINRWPEPDEQVKIAQKIKAGLKFGYGSTVVSIPKSIRPRSIHTEINSGYGKCKGGYAGLLESGFTECKGTGGLCASAMKLDGR